MSDFELKDLGGGRFELSGDMSFATVDRILRDSETLFRSHPALEVDFSKVRKADSAGLALLLEWKAMARQSRKEISYTAVPRSVLAVARTTEVGDLI
jgi:phospholipid transport system transporter-binding protein